MKYQERGKMRRTDLTRLRQLKTMHGLTTESVSVPRGPVTVSTEREEIAVV